MKALLCEQFSSYRDLRLVEVALPEPLPGQLRIAVHYATAGFGQTLVMAGTYQRRPPLPFVPGTEVSGVVTAVVPGVTRFRVGDRVTAALDWGGYGEQAVAFESTTWRVPDGMDLATAASMALTYGTAYAALHWRAHIQPGDTLLVYGAAGGVGLPAVQLGRLAGAQVIAVAGSQQRVDLALGHGAHMGLISSGANLGKRILALNGGRAVDIVFDPIGGSLFAEALRCLAAEGRILLIGFASGDVPAIAANHLLVKNAEVIGFNMGLYIGWGLTDERQRYEQRMRAMLEHLFEYVVRGELVPVRSTVYPLAQFREAFDTVLARQSVGRVLLQVTDSLAA